MNGMPGIGGSMGQCAFCGQSFVAEVMLGRPIPCFRIAQVEGDLFAHQRCMDKYGATKSMFDWPESSPVRRAVDAHNSKIDELDQPETTKEPTQ